MRATSSALTNCTGHTKLLPLKTKDIDCDGKKGDGTKFSAIGNVYEVDGGNPQLLESMIAWDLRR